MIEEHATQTQEPALTVTQMYGKLPAQDIERARAFYDEKLGLTPFSELHHHLHYEIGGAGFVIFPSTGEPSGNHDQLGLVVADLERAVSRLRERGLVFESYPPPPGATVTDGILDAGHVRAAWFKDSEGNLISLAEFAAGSPFDR